jgi:Antitoxin ParD
MLWIHCRSSRSRFSLGRGTATIDLSDAKTHICVNVSVSKGVAPMSRLTIDITDNQHQSLKALAALQGKTIKQYAIERLFPAQSGDDKAWQELKTLLGQRINEGLSGAMSGKSIGGILDEELGGGSLA